MSRAISLVRLRNKEGLRPAIKIKKRKYADGGGVPTFDPSQSFETVTNSAPAFDPSKPFEPATPQMSTAGAAFEGFKKGASANWSDEIYGASKASGLPDWLGGFRAPVGAARLAYESLKGEPGQASSDYDTAVAYARERQKAAGEQHPVANLAGNIGGAGLTALAIPSTAAATLPARIAQGAKIGAGYGALAGAGEGTDVTSRLSGAGLGAGAGAVTGALTPPVVEGLIQGGTQLARPVLNTIRGAVDPEGEAGRRVATALARDFQQSGPSLSPEEIAAANLANTPRAIIDAGGETTRALARSSANTSPEAREALTGFTSDRFAGQNDRAAGFIRSISGASGDNAGTLEALQNQARMANKAAYKTAYADGDTQIMTPEIERLMGSPAFVDAMKRAATSGKDRAITEGFGAFNPGVTIDNGIVTFKKGQSGVPTYPNLQFWDVAKRELDDASNAAARQGRNGEASVLGNLSRSLRGELDNVVPSYQAARAGAASAFGAQDALEAGSNFLTSKMNNDEARRAVQQMSVPERALFREGYASQLMNKMQEVGDRRSILNSMAQSPADRERLEIAFGPRGADQVEAYLRSEGIMDRARTAISSNSTTARQLVELGLAGGAYGVASGGDLTNPKALATGAIVWGLTHGNRKINEGLAKRVGEMLVSNDPTVLNRGVQIAARHSNILDGLRRIDGFGTTAASQPAVSSAARIPLGQSIMPAAADQNQQQ